jgi:ethanolamine utilization protein EutA
MTHVQHQSGHHRHHAHDHLEPAGVLAVGRGSAAFDAGWLVEDVEGVDMFIQHSVGIDIGSSTCHVTFSDLTLRRDGSSSRFAVTDRLVVYESPIFLTPYSGPATIDGAALRKLIESSYREASITPGAVDSGVVVITGEALRKENAGPILDLFSREAGRFVTASAGPRHEALLAAHGSGAVEVSRREGWRVLNVDIGGGTAKLAVVDRGDVVETAAVSVGARLVAFDTSSTVTRVEELAPVLLEPGTAPPRVGEPASPQLRAALAARMAACLAEIITGDRLSDSVQQLFITPPLSSYSGAASVDRISFSGGVAEYLYGRTSASYGDLGPELGSSLRAALEHTGALGRVVELRTGIRATALGAGAYAVQSSGNTSYIADADVLPAASLQVVKVAGAGVADLESRIRQALARLDRDCWGPGLALALTLDGSALSYPSLRAAADGVEAVVRTSPTDVPVILLLDVDVARSVGAILSDELRLPHPVIALDGIEVGDLDYVDVNRPFGTSEVVPVTVKSLVVRTSPATGDAIDRHREC